MFLEYIILRIASFRSFFSSRKRKKVCLECRLLFVCFFLPVFCFVFLLAFHLRNLTAPIAWVDVYKTALSFVGFLMGLPFCCVEWWCIGDDDEAPDASSVGGRSNPACSMRSVIAIIRFFEENRRRCHFRRGEYIDVNDNNSMVRFVYGVVAIDVEYSMMKWEAKLNPTKTKRWTPAILAGTQNVEYDTYIVLNHPYVYQQHPFYQWWMCQLHQILFAIESARETTFGKSERECEEQIEVRYIIDHVHPWM